MSEADTVVAKAGACTYILHMLLQRLEETQPGIVEDILSGAKADQASLASQSSASPLTTKIFSEAVSILELIQAANNIAR